MFKLYKSKVATTPHVVSARKLRDFLSPRESIDETGKAYGYVCHRQRLSSNKIIKSTHGIKGFELGDYHLDDSFDEFIMSEDVFADAYEEIEQ